MTFLIKFLKLQLLYLPCGYIITIRALGNQLTFMAVAASCSNMITICDFLCQFMTIKVNWGSQTVWITSQACYSFNNCGKSGHKVGPDHMILF